MHRIFFLITFLCGSALFADDTFSKERLVAFYDNFFCEQQNSLSSSNLTPPCTFNPNPDPFVPPPNPPPPPFKNGLLPIVLVNNSTLPDTEVFIVITGDNVADTNQVWGVIDTSTGVVTLQNLVLGDNGSNFSYALSSLPVSSNGRVIYVPEVRSGLIWFSMLNKLNMPVASVSGTPPIQVVQPNFTSSSDPNYTTNFDIFEFTFLLAGSPQIAADATAVSFFSIPLYAYLAGATTVSSNTGLYQPRSFIMAQALAAFNTAPESAQWKKLLLTQGGSTLRLLATGKAMAASLFDPNYLDDSAAYGYSYLADIWTDNPSYYHNNNPLNLTVTVTKPSTATYTYQGRVQSDNTFLFTSMDGGPDVTFPAPVTSPSPTGTTSFDIFSAINFITPLPTAGTAADAVSKLVQESIIASLIPTTDTLSLSYLPAHMSSYYTVNSNLSSTGQATGPWFDLYSKALHSLGSIYTYGFDEPLWPGVLIGSPFTNGSTYLGITIGSVQ